jgi:hypothetical protein
MRLEGLHPAFAFTTSAFGSYPNCPQYPDQAP